MTYLHSLIYAFTHFIWKHIFTDLLVNKDTLKLISNERFDIFPHDKSTFNVCQVMQFIYRSLRLFSIFTTLIISPKFHILLKPLEIQSYGHFDYPNRHKHRTLIVHRFLHKHTFVFNPPLPYIVTLFTQPLKIKTVLLHLHISPYHH